jgi:hypothetical protein
VATSAGLCSRHLCGEGRGTRKYHVRKLTSRNSFTDPSQLPDDYIAAASNAGVPYQPRDGSALEDQQRE